MLYLKARGKPMKNFLNSLIRFMVNSIIILALVGLCAIAFVVILSKSSNVPLEESISYVSSFQLEDIHDFFTSSQDNSSSIPTNIMIDSYSDNAPTSNNSPFFYYQQLDSNAKIIYDALYQNIDSLKKENCVIPFDKQFNSLLHETDGQSKLNQSFQSALDAFFYDHPSFFIGSAEVILHHLESLL